MLEYSLLSPKGYFGSNCYIIKSADDYAVIDPSVSFAEAANTVGDISRNLKYIILTHAHFDHFFYLQDWVDKTKRFPVLSAIEATTLSDEYKNCSLGFIGKVLNYNGKYIIVNNGDVLPFGDTEIEIISTPGHSPGSISLKIEDYVFTGDTLFSDGGYGRCDLPGGDSSLIKLSINRLLSLPMNTVMLPGHGSATTVREASEYDYFIY